MSVLFIATAIALTGAVGGPVRAEDGPGGIRVEQPWARATPGRTTNGAAYFKLRNSGKKADRLLAVSTPVARRAELHTHRMSGGIMRMRPVDRVDLSAGGDVTFKPGGYHVMLMGLKSPLKKGTQIPLTLTFKKAGKITLKVPVLGVGAMGPGHGKGGGHHH
jgi:copper(I)-binding protein